MHLENEIDGSVGQSSEGQDDLDFNPPSVRFKSATFSDGTTIELDPTDVVVFVGPNNAGKSVALSELEEHISGLSHARVVNSVEIAKSGTNDEFSKFVDKHLQSQIQDGHRTYSGYGININVGAGTIANLWPDQMGILRPIFCRRLLTETRITDSNPVRAINILNDAPTHPIHLLLLDDATELRISDYFRRAFDEDLIVFRHGGRDTPLLVGQRPVPDLQSGEDRASTSYLNKLRDTTQPLQEQGDGMRSFASVIVHLLAPTTPSVLLLDEPEAFLYPPQARLVGRIIADETSNRAQLFVATHSLEFLLGLVDGASDRLKILRIERKGNKNHVKELDKDLVERLSSNSLMKYSSVLAGVFHERVIICESDADCLFYSSILDVPEVHEGPQPDVLFVHASGKDRMDDLASALVALNIRVDVIADIDIIRDQVKFKSIFEELGGNWSEIEQYASAVRSAVEDRSPSLNAGQIKVAIEVILSEVDPTAREFPREVRRRVEAQFKEASPWERIKGDGRAGFPRGPVTADFDHLIDLCKQRGLWIVPVGELEGFCRYIDSKGPRWVRKVLENYDLANARELDDARAFMHDIWTT